MKTQQIPGPANRPLVGNLIEFSRDPTAFLTRLAREYGDIAAFRLGRQLAVQVNHPELIRDVLVTHAHNFEKTRGLARASLVIGNGLLTSEGELHRRQRKLLQPAFTHDRLVTYGAMMTACADQFSERWGHGEVVNMADEMLDLTLTIVGHTLFGTDTQALAPEIRGAMCEVFEYFNSLMLPISGHLARLPLARRRRFEKARALLDRIVYETIESRRASGEDRGDLLSMVLLATDAEAGGTGMSNAEARDEIMTMFLAGHETTATALTWTWYLLSQHPEVERALHAELDEVLGGNVPTVEDLPRLQYTRMVLAEAMRLYPPVWTLTRRALSDYRLGEYTIPAGTIVGMSQYVMHRDPRFFPDPACFMPERWIDEEASRRPKYSYFPFGGGPRSCIGERFAWMEMTLLLATLSQRCVARCLQGGEVELQPLITLRPRGGLPMCIERRVCNSSTLTETPSPQMIVHMH